MKEDFINGAYTDESQVNKVRLCTFHFTCNLREILFSEAQSVFPLFYFFKSLACISFLRMYPTTFFAQIFILLLCRWLSQSHQWSTIILAAVIIFLLTCPLPWSCILQLQDFFFFFWPLHSTGWDLLEDAGCRKPGSLFSILRSTVATRKILLGYCIQT